MNSKKLDYIVYIGRFQPFHTGHFNTLSAALDEANHVIVVVGSHNSPRTIKNPFTAPEREQMIRACFTEERSQRFHFVYMEDRLYSDTSWVRAVEAAVTSVMLDVDGIKEPNGSRHFSQKKPLPKVGIIGHKKDKSTAGYVNQFKQWETVDTPCINVGDGQPLNATKIRELLFSGHVNFTRAAVSDITFANLVDFTKTGEFAALKAEYEAGIEYERLYENAPFHTTNFYTADSVVIQSGRVLLVKRGQAPGKGLWALPGGHVNPSETAAEASIRELLEETNLKVPKKVLRGSMFCEKLFDHPERSMRARISKKNARTVDVAFGYKLDDAADLPGVKAGDDAEKAWWFTFDEVAKMRGELFEDHGDIIEYMLARVEK